MRSLNVMTIVGARPQFIKAAPVSQALQEAGHQETFIHTGQHYDHGLSSVFFDELGINEPTYNLGVGSGTHGWQTAQMLLRIEEVLLKEHPDIVLIYGDTNSTLAGALAACKLHLPLAHIEAGLRSYNREMPEEYNRILADHCSDLLFCPTQIAADNLAKEGISKGVHLVGDVMYDAALLFGGIARERSGIIQEVGLNQGSYLLATIHRPYNTDIPENLRSILSAFLRIEELIVFPVHPRTRKRIDELDGISLGESGVSNLKIIEPVGYLDMLMLEQNARMIMTDSGGVQKEAYFFGVPCITVRPETEWVETVESGWNVLVGSEIDRLPDVVKSFSPPSTRLSLFGDGKAAKKIVDLLSTEV